MITFDNVTKSYGNVTALRNLSFTVRKGDLTFVTGPSGSGKSTLLSMIYRAERPDSGSVSVAGWNTAFLKESSIPYLRRKIGVIFQDFKLLEKRTVFDNIAIALRIRGVSSWRLKERVYEALKLVNLREKIQSYPEALSGGEQQRITIARAIVGEPSILLADEPTGNLDPDTAAGIMELLGKINSKGTTTLIATHNKSLFMNTGARVIRLAGGNLILDGRV